MKCKEIPEKKNNTFQKFYFVYPNNRNWQKYLLKATLFVFSKNEKQKDTYACTSHKVPLRNGYNNIVS